MEANDTVKISNESNGNLMGKEEPVASTTLDGEKGSAKSKQRIKKDFNYAQTIRKIKRNNGEKYTTRTLKVVNAKVFENKDCFCSKKCLNLLSCEERKSNFDNFWKLGDFKKQNLFLCLAVHKRMVRQRRPRTFEREKRKWSYEYFLPTANFVKVPVCKRFFLDTFKISGGRLSRALNADIPGTDLRGKMPGSSRKTSEDKIKVVREHIMSFPAYERPDGGGRKYLSPDLDIRKMYRLYAEKCKERNEAYVNEWTYRKVFKTEFNLDFHLPRKDDEQKWSDLQKVQVEPRKEENKAAEFLGEVLDLSPVKERRKSCEKIQTIPLCPIFGSVSKKKSRNKDLLPYIPNVYREYFETIQTGNPVGETRGDDRK